MYIQIYRTQKELFQIARQVKYYSRRINIKKLPIYFGKLFKLFKIYETRNHIEGKLLSWVN